METVYVISTEKTKPCLQKRLKLYSHTEVFFSLPKIRAHILLQGKGFTVSKCHGQFLSLSVRSCHCRIVKWIVPSVYTEWCDSLMSISKNSIHLNYQNLHRMFILLKINVGFFEQDLFNDINKQSFSFRSWESPSKTF